jgi:hypothetical protein
MTEFEEEKLLSQETKLVFNFKEIHDFNWDLISGDSIHNSNQKLPRIE